MCINSEKANEAKNQKVIEVIINYAKEHIEIVAIAFTIVSAIANAFFYFGSYVYSMGVYDYWNIPHIYIERNNENLLFKFILSGCIIIVLFITSYVYTEYITKRLKNEEWYKKIEIGLWYFALGTVALMILCIILMAFYVPLVEAVLFVIPLSLSSLLKTILLSGIIHALVLAWGNLEKELFLAIRGTHTKNKGYYGVCVIFIIIALVYIFWCIYDSGMYSVKQEKKFTIATVQDTNYIVLNGYKDKWIVKECFDKEDNWYINRESYRFMDLDGIPLSIRVLGEDDSLNLHILDTNYSQTGNVTEKNGIEEKAMNNFITWCNQNQGFLSALLSFLALLLSVMTLIMSYRIGKMPFKKKLKMIPVLYVQQGEFYVDLMLINCGNTTISIENVGIYNNDKLNIGMPEEEVYITLKAQDYHKMKIRLYEDLENIKENQLDLNNHIVVVAHDVDGTVYEAKKGFPVG